MEKTSLKQLAYKQQIEHLSRAHSQALRTIIENQQPFRLTVNDALAYLELAKIKLDPTEFTEFMHIMRECREPNSDPMVTLSRVCCLLQNYPELLKGFGMFLPPSLNLQLQTSGRFLIKNQTGNKSAMKSEVNDQNDIQPRRKKIDPSIVKQEDKAGSAHASSSLDKDCNVSKEVDDEYAILYLSKVKESFQNEPHIFEKFLQLLDAVRRSCLGAQTDLETDVFLEICELFQGHDDLIEEFKTFVPNANFPNEQQEDLANSVDAVESDDEKDDSERSSNSSPDFSNYSGVRDPSVASVYKYGTYEEHLFFDKVREAIGHRDVYDNFLRCLMLFNEDIVTRSELLKVATSFLGRTPELLKQFKDMLGIKESGENIELIPMKIISYEKNRLDPEVALDIDYATGGRNGASYRALPKNYKQPKCSGRTPLCKEVLNDTWVSFPSWSEDSTFVTSCKTQYEEMIYRCEDERFELDMAIKTNLHTIQVLENVQKKINKMTPEEKSMFSLDDTLGGTSTVLHQKALHRLYGDKIDELVDGLKRNPVVAVPIILKRLKGKDEEWKEKQKQFNAIWREQIDNYYLKSLDHQGINFKQNDSKSFRPKSLLNEMEMVDAERKAGNAFNSSLPHFCLEFKEMCVFLDAINLICLYLKKLPGVFRDDRRRIEHLVRHFIPDFFGFPCSSTEEEETEEEEAERPDGDMEIENDGDEKSGRTSPSESCGFSRDAFSEQDESNSVEENELSDETDKNSFIEEIDIFDKLDSLPPTNMPYTLFFVNKNWYVFFRQFHIFCERLSMLLHKSVGRHSHSLEKTEHGSNEDELDNKTKEIKPSYAELIGKLSQLLSGAIDYAQFEDEARSLFGIHAFLSFTMDKLVLNIVRQLQQIVSDDIGKPCTALFFQHTKTISDIGCSSPLETALIEMEYFKKVEQIMGDEKCFKILWHKKEQTITIELIEEAPENVEDPCDVERWSNYMDIYVTEDSVCEDMLLHDEGLPVILPRNLRRQQEYWKRKVAYVDNLWKTRYSSSFLNSNLPLSFKRKLNLKPSNAHPSKMSRLLSKERNEDSIISSSENIVSEDTESNSKTDQVTVSSDPSPSNVIIKDLDSKLDDSCSSSSFIKEIKSTVKSDSEKSLGFIDSDEECDQDDDENEVDDQIETLDKEETPRRISSEDIKSDCFFEETQRHDISLGAIKEDRDSVYVDYNSYSSFISHDKRESSHDTLDSIEENIRFEKNYENSLLSIGAFHDIEQEEEESNDFPEKVQEPSLDESVAVDDSNEEVVAAASDSDSAEQLEKNEEEIEEPKNDSPEPPAKTTKKATKREYIIRPRRQRPHQDYVKRRVRKSIQRSSQSVNLKERRTKVLSRLLEEFGDFSFDYTYFSKLADDEKCLYLAMKSLKVHDGTEVSFNTDSYKMYFVQNCDLYVYRKNCLTRAKQIHQQVSEIKTSNFNAWHRIWLDRYVTSSMLKSCNDWLFRSELGKYKVVEVTVTNVTEPPYIPYSKYRVRYYKTQT